MLNIRKRRLLHDPPLTQQGLAVLAGLHEATVRRIEREGSANSRTLTAIADALGVSIAVLFDDAKEAS